MKAFCEEWTNFQIEDPFKTASLPEPPWLIVAPHPDDESLGMGGTIIKARKARYPVKIVFVTSGELFADPIIRKEEAQRAVCTLGLSNKDMVFWEIPDGKVLEHKEIFVQKFVEAINSFQPSTIFLPSFIEHHADHRATARFAWETLEKKAFDVKSIWLYEVYNLHAFNRLIDISDVFRQKEKAVCKYKSQLEKLPYHKFVRALNFFRSLYLCHLGAKYVEAFWEIKLK